MFKNNLGTPPIGIFERSGNAVVLNNNTTSSYVALKLSQIFAFFVKENPGSQTRTVDSV